MNTKFKIINEKNLNYLLLKKLTIVIITYNRHIYLKRTINYWSNYNVKLLILDGSPTRFKDKCLESKNVRYIYSNKSYYERLLSSINYIKTEFAILGSDDEFYFPSALSSCITFLIKETSFSTCGGCAIGFITSKKKILGTEAYPELKNFCIDYDSAKKRIFKHFINYVPAHIYSVMRFKIWKVIFKYVFKKRYNFAGAHELQLEFLSVMAGKSKIIQELMWMRNKEVPSELFEFNIQTTLKKWWFYENYRNEKIDFLKNMKKACNEILVDQNLRLNEIEDTIVSSFEIYIKKYFPKRNFSNAIKDLLPNEIKNLIINILVFLNRIKFRLIYWYKIKTKKFKSLLFEINRLEKQGISINYKELNAIIASIRDFKIKN